MLVLNIPTSKTCTLTWFCAFWAIRRQNLSKVRSLCMPQKTKSESNIFTYLPRSPAWMDFYQIWLV